MFDNKQTFWIEFQEPGNGLEKLSAKINWDKCQLCHPQEQEIF